MSALLFLVGFEFLVKKMCMINEIHSKIIKKLFLISSPGDSILFQVFALSALCSLLYCFPGSIGCYVGMLRFDLLTSSL